MSRMQQADIEREGQTAKALEQRTAQFPSDWWLWAAAGSILGALTLRMIGRRDDAQFVGQWAPTLLILGLYNKLVKMFGSE